MACSENIAATVRYNGIGVGAALLVRSLLVKCFQLTKLKECRIYQHFRGGI